MICRLCGEKHIGHCSRLIKQLKEEIKALKEMNVTLHTDPEKEECNVTCKECLKNKEQTRARVTKHRVNSKATNKKVVAK
jgi:hypothetical protein